MTRRPTCTDARWRAPVTCLIDSGVGRGRLVYWPPGAMQRTNRSKGGRSPGARARVQLDSGKYVSVHPNDVDLLDEEVSP